MQKNVRFTIEWRYVANIHKLASSEICLCLALELVILVRSRDLAILSVCVSVRLSRSSIVWKRLNI